MTPTPDRGPGVFMRARKRTHVACPVQLVESDLPDDAVRAFLRILIADEVHGVGDDGNMTDDQLLDAIGGDRARAAAVVELLDDRGFLHPATAPAPPPEPREPEPARWTGEEWTAPRGTLGGLPGPGTPVVYYLLDGDQVVYIGATKSLRTRLNGHRDKAWTAVRARECNSRQAADDLELVEIDRLAPALNVAPGSVAAIARAGRQR